METNSKDIITPDKVSEPSQEPPASTCHLFDLNMDCVREIVKYLRISDQYALMKSSENFTDFILYDIWEPKKTTTLDIDIESQLDKRPRVFKADLLECLLLHFARIKGISLDVFQLCMKRSVVKKFKLTEQLYILNRGPDYNETSVLNVKDFNRFPLLRDLFMQGAMIHYSDINLNIPFNCVHIKRCPVKVFQTRKVYARYMEQLRLTEMPRSKVSLRQFVIRWIKRNWLKMYLHSSGYPLDDTLEKRRRECIHRI